MPPSIDSLDLPPFKPRFPWWGADLQTLSVSCSRPRRTCRRIPASASAFRWPTAPATSCSACSTVPRSRWPNRPLVILIHGLTGCEDSVYILSAARHLLDLGYTVLRLNVRGGGPSRAYCGEHYHVGRTADFRRVLWQLPEDADARWHGRDRLFVRRHDAAEVSRRGGLVLAVARGGDDLRADRPDAATRGTWRSRATGSITTTC